MLTFLRVIKFAGQSFFRNFWLSIVTIVMIVLSLLSISGIFTISLITESTLKSIEQSTVVYIDLTEQASNEQAQAIVNTLKKLPIVKNAEIVSSEKALESFKKRHERDDLVLKALGSLKSNPFNGSIRLSVYNISEFPGLLKELGRQEYEKVLQIDDQEFGDSQFLIAKLSNFSNKLQKIGFIMSALFMIIAILVVFNTIQVAIYTHREEINIMKLVGASNMFIRSPFLIEAAMYSLISIFIHLILLILLFVLFQPYFSAFLQQYPVSLIDLFKSHWLWYVVYNFLVCLLITLLSAFVATRKYLKN
jgi:cell division transport system permease protein